MPPAPDRALSPLRLTTVTTTAGLIALGPGWNQVFAQALTRSPFLAHDWILAWWEAFGDGQELYVLVLEDDDGIAAIAPLARARRSFGPVAYRTLELLGTGPLLFLGMGLADRADFLLARRPTECLAGIVAHLADCRRDWDVLDLRFVPDDATSALELTQLAATAGLGARQVPCSQSPYLPLEGTWEEYLSRRSRNFRKHLKRDLRRLEEMGEVRFDLAAERRGDPLELFDRIVEVSLESWKAEAGSALFQHRNVRQFLQRVIPALVARDGLYVAVCEVDGEIAAHDFGFRLDRKLWSYDSCFRARFGAGSPGNLLTARLLEESWADGLVEYDFLRGGEGYKLGWQTQVRREQQLVLDASTIRGRLAFQLGFAAKWALKRSPRLLDLQSRLAGRFHRMMTKGQ